ncbi:MAG: hypothetical protein ABI541_04020 [Betaproteobacteria bacterium]
MAPDTRKWDTFPQRELIEPHAQRAFDLLVLQVEQSVPLPPDQCIPRGGAIASGSARALRSSLCTLSRGRASGHGVVR